jgi:pyrroline-5-carboxylate reductase
VFDRNAPKLEMIKELGAQAAGSAKEVAKQATIIFVAVKPYAIEAALKDIRDELTADKVLVSVAAGVTIETISRHLSQQTQVVRVMPNTPCLVGQGVSAVSPGPHATKESVAAVTKIFMAVGVAIEMDEKFLDAVTGLSGSGPAFVYIFIEALADGGVRSGLPRDVAMKLAVQLVKGSAMMVEQTKQHPGELKDKVTSPGGTTIAGIHALESAGFRGATMDAVYAATNRSRELGKLAKQ